MGTIDEAHDSARQLAWAIYFLLDPPPKRDGRVEHFLNKLLPVHQSLGPATPHLLANANRPLRAGSIVAATAHQLVWAYAHRLQLAISDRQSQDSVSAKKPIGRVFTLDAEWLDNNWEKVRRFLRRFAARNPWRVDSILARLDIERARASSANPNMPRPDPRKEIAFAAWNGPATTIAKAHDEFKQQCRSQGLRIVAPDQMRNLAKAGSNGVPLKQRDRGRPKKAK